MAQMDEKLYGFGGQEYRLGESKGRGGEGAVYLTDHPGIAAKIYHNPTEVQERKIQCMLRKKIATRTADGTPLIAWPMDILFQNGRFVGYTMPLIEGGKPIYILFRDKDTRDFFKDYNWTKSLCVALNLAHLVDIIHSNECVIGDMNPGNMIVYPNGWVSILDVDSFDITDPATGEHFKCGVGMPDYLAPELQHRKSLKDESSKFTKHTDEFALAVNIFQLLFHYHPFLAVNMESYVASSDTNQRDQNIVNGICPFVRKIDNVALPVGAPELGLVPPFIQEDFKRTFTYTALDSVAKSAQRTSARTWYEHLNALYSSVGTLMLPCNKNPEHYRRADQPCELCRAQERKNLWEKQYRKQQNGAAPSSQNTDKQSAGSQAAAQTAAASRQVSGNARTNKKFGWFFLIIVGIMLTILGFWLGTGGMQQIKYRAAISSLDEGDYVSAIESFEELENYEDSGDYLMIAKACYVQENLNCEDRRTYLYLSELRESSEDFREIFDSLYRWRAEFIGVNTDADDTSTEISTIEAGTTVYWHYKITGGIPGESTYIYYQLHCEGESGKLLKTEDPYSNNTTGWVSWETTGVDTGTVVSLRLYDEDQELLGEKEIKIL